MTASLQRSPPRQRPALVLLGMTSGAMLAFLDATMLNIALPSLQAAWQTDLSTISWVLTAYNLAFALLPIPAGRWADHFGHKRLFLAALLLFGAGAIGCALAPSLSCLIAARALQGAGGAIVSTVGLATILTTFAAGPRRQMALGIWGAANGLALAIGPLLGALLVQFLSWPALFWATLPLVIFSGGVVLFGVQERRRKRSTRHRSDGMGLLLLGLALTGSTLLLLQGPKWGWLASRTLWLAEGSLLSTGEWLLVESRHAHPLVNLRLLTDRSFAIGALSMLLFAAALMGAFVVFVLYVRAQGSSPLQAALLLLPTPVTSFGVSLVAGRLGARLPPRRSAMGGLLVLAVGLVSLSTLLPPLTLEAVLWRGMLIGTGMGLGFASLPSVALRTMTRRDAGQASGIFGLAQQVGFTLGVALLSSMLTAGQPSAPMQPAFVRTWLLAAALALTAAGVLVLPVLLPTRRTRDEALLSGVLTDTDKECNAHRRRRTSEGRAPGWPKRSTRAHLIEQRKERQAERPKRRARPRR